MKKDIHPKGYRMVVFEDASSGAQFIVGSTVETTETTVWTDKNTYPLYRVETSSASHPFYTGADKVLDTQGRAEKFKQRAAKSKAKAKSS